MPLTHTLLHPLPPMTKKMTRRLPLDHLPLLPPGETVKVGTVGDEGPNPEVAVDPGRVTETVADATGPGPGLAVVTAVAAAAEDPGAGTGTAPGTATETGTRTETVSVEDGRDGTVVNVTARTQ